MAYFQAKIVESRRKFITSCALLAATLIVEVLGASGCGSTSSGGTSSAPSTPVSGGNCGTNGTKIYVGPASDGHTHSAPTVSAADVTSGSAKQYTLGTAESHTHTVSLSQANFTTLKGNQGVSLTTDSDSTGHTHTVVVNCS